MAIDCDHPRPKLNLPGYTPPRFSWQPPAILPTGSLADLARALTEQFRGVYAVLQQLGQRRTIVPLLEDIDARAGQVIVGVGAGQTIRLPEGIPGDLGQVGVVLTDVSSPVTLVHPDGTTTSLGEAGAYDFVSGIPETYQTNPGGAVLGGGVPTDRLLGRDSAGTGAVEFIEAGPGLEFSGAGAVRISGAAAGDGLTGGAGSALAVGAGDGIDVAADSVAVDVGDLAGTGLEDDGLNNLRIASSAAGAGLTGGSGSALAVGAGTLITVAADAVGLSDLAGLSVIGRAASTTGAPAAVTATTARQVLRYDGTSLEWDFPIRVFANGGSGGLVDDAHSINFIAGTNTTAAVGGVSPAPTVAISVDDYPLTGLADQADDTFLANIAGLPAPPTAVALSTLAGAGLTGGANAVLAVGAGTRITVNADDVQLSAGAAESFLGNFTASTGVADYRAGSSVAGAGLTYTAGGTLAVGAGTGISVTADSVSVSNIPLTALANQADDTFLANIAGGSAPPTAVALSTLAGDGLQGGANGVLNIDVSDFAGTGLEDDGSENLRIASSAAGAGLTGGSGSALAVGAGAGITVNADDVAWTGVPLYENGSGPVLTATLIDYWAGDGLAVDVQDFGSGVARVTYNAIGNGATWTEKEDSGTGTLNDVTRPNDERHVMFSGLNATVTGIAGATQRGAMLAASHQGTGYTQFNFNDVSSAATARFFQAQSSNIRLIDNEGALFVALDVTAGAGDAQRWVCVSHRPPFCNTSVNAAGDALAHNGTDWVVVAGGNSADVVLRGNATFGTVSTAALANDAVTNAKMANMAQSTIKGRAEGAGTGDPTDLTPTQVATVIDGENIDWGGNHSFGQRMRFTGVLSSTMVGQINNLSVTTVGIVRLTPSGSPQQITGMVAGGDGQMVILMNCSNSLTIRVVDESDATDGTDSTAANRFNLPDTTSQTIAERGMGIFVYDGVVDRWRGNIF